MRASSARCSSCHQDRSRLRVKGEAGMSAFIAHSPFLLIATADADGRCDVSPKGDAPGFVQVLDERRLAIPDRPGNKRLDGMQNLLTNPHVGLVFLVPGRDESLRVNGRAWITRDPEILRRSLARGKMPSLAIGVEVDQCFFHCGKALLRSRLWAYEGWPAHDALTSVRVCPVRPDPAARRDRAGLRAGHRRGQRHALVPEFSLA